MDLNNLTLHELRGIWTEYWGEIPQKNIGKTMLKKSIAFKRWEQKTGGVPKPIQKQINDLIKSIETKSNKTITPKPVLKNGTRLVKIYKGQKHVVLVTDKGLQYNNQTWSSLTKIANHITGSKWNGWVFFGLKKDQSSSSSI